MEDIQSNFEFDESNSFKEFDFNDIQNIKNVWKWGIPVKVSVQRNPFKRYELPELIDNLINNCNILGDYFHELTNGNLYGITINDNIIDYSIALVCRDYPFGDLDINEFASLLKEWQQDNNLDFP